MAKVQRVGRDSKFGKFTTGKIGPKKAAKFSAVEGLRLSKDSHNNYEKMTARGLKGDALRVAITGTFKSKRPK